MSLAVLTATIAFLPLLLPRGPGNTAPVDLLVILYFCVSVLGLLYQRRSLHIPAGPAILFVLVGSVLALVASLDVPAGLLTLIVDVYLFCLFIVVANELDSQRPLEVALTIWVIAALGWALLLICSTQGWLLSGFEGSLGVASGSERATGAAGNPNMFASYMLTSCFVALAAPWPRWRPARVVVFGVLMIAMYLTGSNGALGAFLGGVAMFGIGVYLRRGRSREQIMGLVGVAVLAGAGLILLAASFAPSPGTGVADITALARSEEQGALALTIGRLDEGLGERLAIWSSGWQGAAPRLAVGIGPGEGIKYAATISGVPISLHNDLLAFLIERGVLGLLGFLILQKMLLGWGGRLMVTAGRGYEAYRGLGAAVVANLVFSLSHETLHFRHVWVLYGMVWAAFAVVSARQRLVQPRGRLTVPP